KSGERKSAEQRAESKEQRAESKEWSAVVCCQAGQAEILRSPLSALRSSLSAPSSPLFALRSLLLARRVARRAPRCPTGSAVRHLRFRKGRPAAGSCESAQRCRASDRGHASAAGGRVGRPALRG